MRRSGLKRKTPMARKPSTLKRSKSLAKRSAKTQDVYEREGGRRDFVERILAERPLCEACPIKAKHDKKANTPHASVDVHEIKTRAMGGDVLDDKNVLAVCRWSHDWIHGHPAKARELGLLGSRYNRA